MLSKHAAFLVGRGEKRAGGGMGVGRDQVSVPFAGAKAAQSWSGGTGGAGTSALGSSSKRARARQSLSIRGARPCHGVSPCPPSTAESPTVTLTCWDPFAGDTSLQTKGFCCSLIFHFQTSSKPAPCRPSLDPRDNIITPEQHFVPCVH